MLCNLHLVNHISKFIKLAFSKEVAQYLYSFKQCFECFYYHLLTKTQVCD